MMRIHGRSTTMRRWMIVSAACLLVIACKKKGPETIGAPSRGVILTEAETNYAFGPERAATPVDSTTVPGPGGTLPTITISTATQKSAAGRFPQNRFSYRLTSTGAYPTMGIAPGENFVWRDSSSSPEGPYRLLLVPKDTAYPMVWLRLDSGRPYVPGPATEPRLVKSPFAYGACDNNCTPHCITRSSLRNFADSDTLMITYGAKR